MTPDSAQAPADVSVIVRTRDRPRYLQRALRSIVGQAIRPSEVVVVCDGGNVCEVRALLDATRGAAATPEITFIGNAIPVGRAAALNQGLERAKGTWIAILDDDDTWHPDFLERTVGHLTETPAVAGVATFTTTIFEREQDDRWKELRRRRFNPADLAEITIQELAARSLFTINAFVYLREAGRALGGYRDDLPVQEDWEFNLRFAARHRIGLIADPLAYYHQRPGLPGPAANTDTALRRLTRARVQSEWLKEEIAAGRFGLGWLSYQADVRLELQFLVKLKSLIKRVLPRGEFRA